MWLAKKPLPYRAARSPTSVLLTAACQTNGGVPFSGRGAEVNDSSGLRNRPVQSTASSRQSRRSSA